MKSEDSMTLKIRRRDTEELKVEAVRVVCDSARPVAQVARDLGIASHRQEVCKWVSGGGPFGLIVSVALHTF